MKSKPEAFIIKFSGGMVRKYGKFAPPSNMIFNEVARHVVATQVIRSFIVAGEVPTLDIDTYGVINTSNSADDNGL